MKSIDLAKMRSDYGLFNVVLFMNRLPAASKVDFTLNGCRFAAGYAMHKEKPDPATGNRLEISFSRIFDFPQNVLRGVLVHEMIHIWQSEVVSPDRYTYCTNSVAHDGVFRAKMRTVNTILARNGFDITVTETFGTKCKMGGSRARKPFSVVFYRDLGGVTYAAKVPKAFLPRYVRGMFENYGGSASAITGSFRDVWAVTTDSRLFALLPYERKFRPLLARDDNPESRTPLSEVPEIAAAERKYFVRDGDIICKEG